MSTAADRSGTSFPPALQDALAWLGAPPENDPLRDLSPLRRHLDGLAKLTVPPLQYLKILELFQTRTNLTGSVVKPLLLDATLPLPARLRTVAQGLMDIHGLLAAAYRKVVLQADAERLRRVHRTPIGLCAAGLSNLAQQYEVAQLICTSSPPDLWRTAYELFNRIRRAMPVDAAEAPEASNAERALKVMLALSVAQPENFSPREVAFLTEYLRIQAATVDIDDHAASNGFWLDPTRDEAPFAAVRRPSPEGEHVLRFSCAKLGASVRAHVARLAAGENPETVGLPGLASSQDYRDVLTRAERYWSAPPKRQNHRRRNGYRVQVCSQLGTLWQALHAEVPGTTELDLAASDWMILNEGPGGCAIMHVAGELSGIVAGSALGLRAAPAQPWNICIVRWARSENPEHIELGLEIVAPRAEAVRIVRRTDGGEASPVPALLLPPLPGLKRGESLLTTRGQFAPGTFALMDATDTHLHVAECRAEQLAMHTACVEVFEFERSTVS